jgi:hypothetical protein
MPKRRRDDAPPVCRNPSLTPNAVVTVINDGPRLTRGAGPILLGTHMSPRIQIHELQMTRLESEGQMHRPHRCRDSLGAMS